MEYNIFLLNQLTKQYNHAINIVLIIGQKQKHKGKKNENEMKYALLP